MPIHPSGTLINNRYEVVQGPHEKRSLAGGMGLVYLCVDHGDDKRPVALKTFRPELLSNRDARDRFLREGTTWVELGYHPHIVRCYEVFKESVGADLFISLELIAAAEGKTDASLRSWLTPSKPLNVVQALLFGINIVRGMLHATSTIRGLVHWDLKPENILVGRDWIARITDFGLVDAAHQLKSDWQSNTDDTSAHIRTQFTRGITGTPFYMAPGQWAGDKLDERTDIYAFGCVLYEMICGTFAVTGKSLEELKGSHCQGNLSPIQSYIPDPVCDLIRNSLAMNAADRYTDWSALLTTLTDTYRAICGEPTPAMVINKADHRFGAIARGWSYNAIGLSYHDIGKFTVACDYFEQVRTIACQHHDRQLEGVALGNLGIAYFQLGNARHAIPFFEGHLAIARNLGNRHGERTALGNLGNAYRQLGDMRHAIALFEQCLDILGELGDRPAWRRPNPEQSGNYLPSIRRHPLRN